MRKALAIVALLSALALAGCSTNVARPAPSAPAQVAAPNVTGLAGDVARDAIQASGLAVEWDSDRAVVLPSNWTVVGQDPAAGTLVAAGGKVTLKVTKPQPATPSPVPVEPSRPVVQEPQQVEQPPAQQAPAEQPPAQAPSSNVSYKNCDAVRAAGAAPLYRGQPGYTAKLDRDGDGIACE
ncbi:excalibur calcium-binding domain-containing protein [Microbacterium sp. X-17]|uniref:excalibur calcium-binding domain-containing protein n=1 Tax=Microbacterium sp. X-17 TaxID=3144404 RepID=UPI0031F57C91